MASGAMTLEARVDALRRAIAPRAKSLLVSLYGDVVLPHGGAVWLGDLVRLAGPFGLGERLIRTSVWRLAREGWLTSEAHGRRRRYSLTPVGQGYFDAAQQRIYATRARRWDKTWRLVHATTLATAEDRRQLRRALGWQGFGILAPGLYAHPWAETDVTGTLVALGLSDKVVAMTARTDTAHPEALGAQIASGWDMAALDTQYSAFIDRFAILRESVAGGRRLKPETCFVARVLLIHEYRRALLRDPDLPRALLPPDWVGHAARNLCRDLYRRLHGPALDWARGILRDADGSDGQAPPVDDAYWSRFGGLPAPSP